MKRFDLCASTHTDAITYIKNRALQIAHTGAVLTGIRQFNEGIWGVFEFEHNTYYSLYLLKQYRGNGMYYKLWSELCKDRGYDVKIMTTTACNMAPYLRHKMIPYLLINGLTNTTEYNLIESMYDALHAKRSLVPYINHIDEGLYILHKINASLEAKLGYILHPIFQSDLELEHFFNNGQMNDISRKAIINAMEYRSVANEYLSFRTVTNIDEIRLSPLKDVNDMLIADKIQNCKDFELYHLGEHPRSNELSLYFKNWMERLNVSDEFYQSTKNELVVLTNKEYVNIK